MEPAVRSPRTETAIITDRAQNGALGLPGLPIFPAAERYWPWKPCRGEQNFWMQRREAKIGLKDRKCHQRPKKRNDTGENPHGNGLFGAGPETCGLEGLDGGGSRAQTGDPPPSHRNRSPAAEPGTEICHAETGTQKPAYHLAETNPETPRSAKSPHSGAINAKRLAEV